MKAADHWGDKLDLIIANGDYLNDVSADWQIVRLYKMLSSMTDSSRPVIITRGNHEAVGSALEKLPIYFGSKNDKFYYKVELGDTLFIVLDIANDLSDDNILISATSDFDSYRQKELEWLRDLATDDKIKNGAYSHVVAVCHMAFPLALERYGVGVSREMLTLLEDMSVDVLLSGHSHKIRFIKAHEQENNTDFPVVIGSIRSDYQVEHEGLGGSAFTGTAVNIDKDGIKILFTNSKNEVRGEYLVK